MEPNSAESSEIWRGAAIVLALAGLVLAVFLGFAYSGSWRSWAAAKWQARIVPVTAPRSTAANTRKGSDEDHGLALPPGTSGTNLPRARHEPANAAEALGQVLQTHRLDPKRTTTVTITSSGQIKSEDRGALTVYDGLPANALRDGAEISGGTPK